MSIHEEVIAFINKFTNNSKRQEVIDCFSYGCCYWFAFILDERFWEYSEEYYSMIVYDEVDNHWACKIDGRVYDITGDVTEGHNWVPWSTIPQKDIKLYDMLVRDCINMEKKYD